MRFPRNQGRARQERVASGEIKYLSSQLGVIDDFSKKSLGVVRVQDAREKGDGRQSSAWALSVPSDARSTTQWRSGLGQVV